MASKHAANSPKLFYIYIYIYYIYIYNHHFQTPHMLHGVVINTEKTVQTRINIPNMQPMGLVPVTSCDHIPSGAYAPWHTACWSSLPNSAALESRQNLAQTGAWSNKNPSLDSTKKIRVEHKNQLLTAQNLQNPWVESMFHFAFHFQISIFCIDFWRWMSHTSPSIHVNPPCLSFLWEGQNPLCVGSPAFSSSPVRDRGTNAGPYEATESPLRRCRRRHPSVPTSSGIGHRWRGFWAHFADFGCDGPCSWW